MAKFKEENTNKLIREIRSLQKTHLVFNKKSLRLRIKTGGQLHFDSYDTINYVSDTILI